MVSRLGKLLPWVRWTLLVIRDLLASVFNKIKVPLLCFFIVFSFVTQYIIISSDAQDQQLPTFNVMYHCDEADACRNQEYGLTSSPEHQLCMSAMQDQLLRLKPRAAQMLFIQQLECALSDDHCAYIDCMAFHNDYLSHGRVN